SLVTTGGGLVLGGDANGRVGGFDQETGKGVWEINLGSPVSGFPISYAVNGRQFIAVSTGGAATTQSFLQLTPELRPSNGNNIFVFALPE
ncbi:MAG: pyrrolo-quinoline quinone, partial [Acidobacteriota bacterium]|nr:pyrrolo-quinoline quinone [Acidobacteriota bacterium]